MVGLAPAAARPHPRTAFLIGWGSGATAGALAGVPGMERVHVVEIEPAVLAMDEFFRHVNDSAMLRPNVRVVVDDARSALQLSRDRFDLIVSEPSNPWLAGIATLYTPEFFRVARSRLADDGVFAQWIQLYQLPIPVIAGIVRNLHSVFPHVQVWFGGRADLVVLGSPQPIVFDDAWLDTLLAPGTSAGRMARDWLNLREPRDLLSHYIMGPESLPKLLERANLIHHDDHPQLEYVAARRFLDFQGGGILDSLIAMGGPRPALLARAFSARRGDPTALRYVEAAHRADPQNLEWLEYAAFIRLQAGDTAFADSTFARILTREPSNPRVLLGMGQVLAGRGDVARANAVLTRALAAGGDTLQAHTALALMHARGANWRAAAEHVRRGLAAARAGTFRRPFPHNTLGDALGSFAADGPIALADSLIGEALARRPGWSRLHALRATTALRDHRCDDAGEEFNELLLYGIDRPDWPVLIDRCLQESAAAARQARN